jgi:hypothetical protein
MKHTGLSKKQAHAPKKVTGKHGVDWFYLAKKYPLKAKEIKRHKADQEFLAKLKEKLEKTP